MTTLTTPPADQNDTVPHTTPTLDAQCSGPESDTETSANGVRGDANITSYTHDNTILLDDIRVDGGTQSRAAMDDAAIEEYTDAVTRGTTLPPLVVFFDGVDHWLADGYHRANAYRAAGITKVPAMVRNGSRRDAVLYSVGANAAHGLRRNNSDKRRSVEMLLADDEWVTWSDREIARQCNVGAPLVADVRKAICNPLTDATTATVEESQNSSATRTVKRNGKVYRQQTKKMAMSPLSVELLRMDEV